MARRKPVDPMKAAAETQAARLRALADEMRHYATGRRDQAMFNAWAEAVQKCSESLTTAVKDADHEWLNGLLDFARGTGKLVINTTIGVAVGTTVTLGVTGALAADGAPSDAAKLIECAQLVVEQAETIEELRRTATITGRIEVTEDDDTAVGTLATEETSTSSDVRPERFVGNRVQYGERDEANRPI